MYVHIGPHLSFSVDFIAIRTVFGFLDAIAVAFEPHHKGSSLLQVRCKESTIVYNEFILSFLSASKSIGHIERQDWITNGWLVKEVRFAS